VNKLSVVILCKNEEHNIKKCLESVIWADEIIVLDTGSTDHTIEICQLYNCKIFYLQEWLGFGKAKKEAVNKASNDWILVVDCDEVVSENLKLKILAIVNEPISNVAYKIKRSSFYLGKKINFSGWRNDYTLRLFNKKNGNFNDLLVHEFVVVDCEIQKIHEELYHYTFPTIKTHISKMIYYSELGAIQSRKNSSILKSILASILKFIKMYFFKCGFLDGKAGLILAINSAFGVYLKYIYIYEKIKNNSL
jgi:glycosyltransferase involved in cell wall biosynthesis